MIQDELTQAVEMGVISFDMSTRVGMEIDHLRAELDNRQMQLDGEHTTCVELFRQVYDLEEELAQARKWSSVWKEWAKWAFNYWRHNNAIVPFTEEQAV